MADQKSIPTPYAAWIVANVTEPYGRCAEETTRMVGIFPELRRVRGHYYCSVWGERTHWWLVAPDGAIIDPTADQFPSAGAGVYIEHVEGNPEPTGRCPNCDGYIWDGGVVCSDACARAYERYIMSGI